MRLWLLLGILVLSLTIVDSYKFRKSTHKEDQSDVSDKEIHAKVKKVLASKADDETEEEEDIAPVKKILKKPSRPQKEEDPSAEDEKVVATKGKKINKGPSKDSDEDQDNYFICDGEKDETCRCANNEVDCDKVEFDDETALQTLQLRVQSDDFVPYFFYARDNDIKTLKKDKVLPVHRKTIRTLDLSDNYISKIEAGAFKGFKELRKLVLTRNRIRRPMAEMFSGELEENLKDLVLDANNIRTLPDGVFSKLESLEKLVLDNNRLKHINKETFKGLSNLQKLSLDNCDLADLPADVFDHLKNLRSLSLIGNPFNEVPKAINNIPKLEHLDLSETKIAEFHNQSLKDDHSVKLIYMQNMEFLYSIQDCAFCGLNNLEEVILSNSTKLYHVDVNAFGNMQGSSPVTTLKVLDLQFCNVSTISEDLYDWDVGNVELLMAGNPIHCDCETDFLVENQVFTFENTRMPKCASPKSVAGKPLIEVKQTDICEFVKSTRRGFRFKKILFFSLLFAVTAMLLYIGFTSKKFQDWLKGTRFSNISYATLKNSERVRLDQDFQPPSDQEAGFENAPNDFQPKPVLV